MKTVILFAKEIPGLNELSSHDFATIINNKLFDYFIIMNSVLFINGESYLFIKEDLQYTRYWMDKIKGKTKNDLLFDYADDLNALELTTKEKALLIAHLFTLPSNILI